MHPSMRAWLDRVGLPLGTGRRLLVDQGVSWLDVYGASPGEDFERGAAEVELLLAKDPRVVLWWSDRPLWQPNPVVNWNQLETPAKNKRFDDVHAALRFVDSRATTADFHCPVIFSPLGVLWNWSSLEQRSELV